MASYISGSGAAVGGFGANSVTVSAGTNSNVIIWAALTADTSSITAPQADSNNMTLFDSYTNPNDSNVNVFVYYYILGSSTGDVTVAGNGGHENIVGWATSGTDQTNPADSTTVKNNRATDFTSQTSSYDITPASADEIIVLAEWGSFGPTTDGGNTEVGTAGYSFSGGSLYVVLRQSTGSSSQNIGATWQNGGYAGIAFVIQDSGGVVATTIGTQVINVS